ncbi:Purine nucleoside phosphorylase [Mycena venus]|uniref:Purine nucleoside phosphorylase n=1 Tax=Mycena venus TaxID=2733690 RepID=A0A8H7CFI1_9AGAR|nr:Purine nucleoside phosphorylase [Mycena venus]
MRGAGRCMLWMLRHGRARGWEQEGLRVWPVYAPPSFLDSIPSRFRQLLRLHNSSQPRHTRRRPTSYSLIPTTELSNSRTQEFPQALIALSICAYLHYPPSLRMAELTGQILAIIYTETASLQLYVVFSQPSFLCTRIRRFKPTKAQLDTKLHACVVISSVFALLFTHLFLLGMAAVVSKLRFTPEMWDARVMGLAVRYRMYWFLIGTSHLPALGAREHCPWGTWMVTLKGALELFSRNPTLFGPWNIQAMFNSDKVSAFAAMWPVELLRETQNAVEDERLKGWNATLVEAGAQLKEVTER